MSLGAFSKKERPQKEIVAGPLTRAFGTLSYRLPCYLKLTPAYAPRNPISTLRCCVQIVCVSCAWCAFFCACFVFGCLLSDVVGVCLVCVWCVLGVCLVVRLCLVYVLGVVCVLSDVVGVCLMRAWGVLGVCLCACCVSVLRMIGVFICWCVLLCVPLCVCVHMLVCAVLMTFLGWLLGFVFGV